MEKLNEIMERYNEEKVFPFLGAELIISPERNVYLHIEKKYRELSFDARKVFTRCLNELKNLDDLYENIDAAFSMALENSLNAISADAISVGCYTMDQNAIIAICFKKGYFKIFEDALKEIVQKDSEIQSCLQNAQAYRAARKATRGRWTSATYGGTMADAWGNQFRAGTMNAIEGAGHSFVNAIGNMVDESKADDARRDLFLNHEYREKLIGSVTQSAYNLTLVIINDLREAEKLSLGGWQTGSDMNKAESIFNNLLRIQMADNEKVKCAISVMNLNPFNSKCYKGLLKLYFDHASEILTVADYFGITELTTDLKDLLADFAKNRLGSSAEELVQCRTLTLECAKTMNMPSESVQPALDIIAKHAEDIMVSFVKYNIGESENDAADCMTKLQALATEIGYTEQTIPQPFQIIRDKMKALDEDYRTINGITFETRDLADKARNEAATYSNVLDNPCNFSFRADFIKHIQTLQTLPIEKRLSEKHIAICQEKLEAFDKVCKTAGKYQYRLEHNKSVFNNGDKTDMSIHYAILIGLALFCLFRIIQTGDKSMILGMIVLLTGFCVYLFYFKPKKERDAWDYVTQKGKIPYFKVISSHISSSENSQFTICPKCQAENNKSGMFCVKCGEKLNSTESE